MEYPLLCLQLRRSSHGNTLTPQQLREVAPPSEVMLSYTLFDVATLTDVLSPTEPAKKEKGEEGEGDAYLRLCQLRDYSGVLVPGECGCRRGFPASEHGVYGQTESGRLLATVDKLKEVKGICQPAQLVSFCEPVGYNEDKRAKAYRNAIFRSSSWQEKLASEVEGQSVSIVELSEQPTDSPVESEGQRSCGAKTAREDQQQGQGDAGERAVSKGQRSEEDTAATCGIDPPPPLPEETALALEKQLLSRNPPILYVANFGSGESLADRYKALNLFRARHHLSLSSSAATRLMVPCDSIPALIGALKAGVQVVESDLPFLLAARGMALTIDFNNEKESKAAAPPVLSLWHHRYERDRHTLLGCRSWCEDKQFGGEPANNTAHQSSCCDCYTCARHTRSYIHHLLMVQELNAHILLAIHNVRQLVLLVRHWRALHRAAWSSSKEAREKLRRFEQQILSQFGTSLPEY